MRKFLRILLAVLFCTTAMCMTDVIAATTTSENVQKTDEQSIRDSIQNVKSTAVNNAFNAYSDEEVYLVAQLVYHEAHNQAYNGKVAIAEVVLNRINSTLFPNRVEDVVFQSGQFTSSRRLKNINPTEQEIRIAFNVLNGSLRVLNDSDVLYFRNPKMTNNISSKVVKNWGDKEYFTHIGDHAFYSQEVKSLTSKTSDEEESIFSKLPTALGITNLFKNKTSVVKNEIKEEKAEKEAEATEIKEEKSETKEDEKIADEAIADLTEADEVAMVNAKLLNMQLKALTAGTEASDENTEEGSDENAGNTEDEEPETLEHLVVENAILMAQANQMLLNVEKKDEEKSAVEEELEDFDENDPVAVARRRALMEQKAESERIAREIENQNKYNALAQEQARNLDQMKVEIIARQNEEMAKATQAAVEEAKYYEGLNK